MLTSVCCHQKTSSVLNFQLHLKFFMAMSCEVNGRVICFCKSFHGYDLKFRLPTCRALMNTCLSVRSSNKWQSQKNYLKLAFWPVLPFSCAKRLASRNVTSRSPSRSLLFPTRIITMLGLARVFASLNQLPSALNVSRLNTKKNISLNTQVHQVKTFCQVSSDSHSSS